MERLDDPNAAHPFRSLSLIPQPFDNDSIALQLAFDYRPWVEGISAKLLIFPPAKPQVDRTMVWLDVSDLIPVDGWTMVHRLDRGLLPNSAIELMLSQLWKPEIRTYRLMLGGFEIGKSYEA